MRCVDIRDLPNMSESLQRMVEDELVTLTSDGVPFALLVGVQEGEDPAELFGFVRQARAQSAVARIRETSIARGLESDLNIINAEIRAAREERNR